MKDKKGLIVIIIAAVLAVSMVVATLAIILQEDHLWNGTTEETTTLAPTVEDYLKSFNVYIEKGEISKALNYGYMYLDESEDEAGIKEVYIKIADIYAEYGNYDAAMLLLKESGIEELYDKYVEYEGMYEGEEDYFYLGSYPQSAYTKDELPEYVVNASFDSNNYACIYGVEYIKEEDVYYAYEPVSWWVIGEDDEKYYLLSEKVLDTKKFHESFGATTWDVSDLRSWLNEEFLNTCFSKEEQMILFEQLTPASDNYYHGFFSGEESKNYVSCISASDLTNGKYVFEGHMEDDVIELRKTYGTDYAIAKGLRIYDNNYCRWWTRTSADRANLYTVVVTEKGYILIESGGEVNNKNDVGVRPFIMVEKEVTNATN